MRKNTGFTLIEIIIALLIFSIISLIMASALHNILNTHAAMEQKTARLAQLQIALLILSHDIEQTVERPVTLANGQLEGFVGEVHRLTFTHTGLSNPFGQFNRATLQRTQYEFFKNQLVRTTWSALDRTRTTPTNQRVLLDHVNDLAFDYLDSTNHFQTTWPPPGQANVKMPRAVRVSLTLEKWGTITQLYLLAGTALEKPH